jgi:hypothetical protein
MVLANVPFEKRPTGKPKPAQRAGGTEHGGHVILPKLAEPPPADVIVAAHQRL